MKKVGKYCIIALLLLLGLCCVGVLYLFFLPGSSLFNITYISKSSEHLSKEYSINSVNKINLNSRTYDVNILPADKDKVYVEVYANSFGFVLNKNKDVNINENLNSGTLTFTITEPHGAAVINNSYVNLYIPTTKSIDLNLKNKNATTTIDSKNLTIHNFTYTTQNGPCQYLNGSIIGELNLNLANSDFEISNKVSTNLNNVNLNLKTGKLSASESNFGDVTILSNKRGIVQIGSCLTLRENVKTAGGRINIKRCSHINVSTTDTKINIEEVTNGAIIELTKTGSISIGTLNGVSALTTNSGNISLNNTNSTLTLTSDTGNINVKNAKLKISAKTNYGSININFAEDAGSYNSNPDARAVIANLKKGKITVKGAENVKINISENGRANVDMQNIYGESYIDGHNGSVKVVVNKSSIYTLTTQTHSGDVKVNLTQIEEFGGYKTKTTRITNVNCSSESTNKFSVFTNSGDLTVLDTNFA